MVHTDTTRRTTDNARGMTYAPHRRAKKLQIHDNRTKLANKHLTIIYALHNIGEAHDIKWV